MGFTDTSQPLMKNPFAGAWRIVWMSEWNQDYIDTDVPGHFTFGSGRCGSFQFGLVQGEMDCRIDRCSNRRIDFTWHGFDEGDELTGRGHAEIIDGELQGHLYVHQGDDSGFRAIRQAPQRKTAPKRKV